MSAFVVSPNTMHKVVSLVEDYGSSPDLQETGRQLYDLNLRAVQQRYPSIKDYHSLPGPEDVANLSTCYKYHRPRYHFTDVQRYKALTCFLYQCHEGNVPDHWLFQYMVKLHDRVAHTIVTELDEYQDAEWDS